MDPCYVSLELWWPSKFQQILWWVQLLPQILSSPRSPPERTSLEELTAVEPRGRILFSVLRCLTKDWKHLQNLSCLVAFLCVLALPTQCFFRHLFCSTQAPQWPLVNWMAKGCGAPTTPRPLLRDFISSPCLLCRICYFYYPLLSLFQSKKKKKK